MAKSESTLTLTNEVRKSLTWHRDHDPRLYVQERAAAILKVADGRTPHWVAKNGLLRPRDPDTVYSWLAIFKAEGISCSNSRCLQSSGYPRTPLGSIRLRSCGAGLAKQYCIGIAYQSAGTN